MIKQSLDLCYNELKKIRVSLRHAKEEITQLENYIDTLFESLEIVGDNYVEHKKRVELKETILVEELYLPVVVVNALKRAGISTLNELVFNSVEDLRGMRNLGPKSIKYIKSAIAKYGLTLREK